MTASGFRPQNGQVVYVDLSEPDTVTFSTRTRRSLDWTACLSVKSIASEIVAYFSEYGHIVICRPQRNRRGLPGRPLKNGQRGRKKKQFSSPSC